MPDDLRRTKIEAHEANLKRYTRLLTTQLTDLERAFIRKRIAEERLAIEKLLSGEVSPPAEAAAPPAAQSACFTEST